MKRKKIFNYSSFGTLVVYFNILIVLLLIVSHLGVLSQNDNQKSSSDREPNEANVPNGRLSSDGNDYPKQDCDNNGKESLLNSVNNDNNNNNNGGEQSGNINKANNSTQAAKSSEPVVDSPVVPTVATLVEMLSFEEWRKKVNSESKPSTSGSVSSSVASGSQTAATIKKSMPKRARNFASHECGAKVVDSNPEAESGLRILNEQMDEYMLNPCKAKIWFVIELCETIEPQSIELANFELFSSVPKELNIQASDQYPSREWSSLGTFTSADERSIQRFDLQKNGFVKFIKIEFLSHYGSEHFCPISVVRVYGTSLFDEVDRIDNLANTAYSETDPEDELSSINEEVVGGSPSSQNLFGTARDAVIDIVRKAAQALNGNSNKISESLQNESRTIIDSKLEAKAIKLLPKLKKYLKNCDEYNNSTTKFLSRCLYIKYFIGNDLFNTVNQQLTNYRLDNRSNLLFQCYVNESFVSQKNITDCIESNHSIEMPKTVLVTDSLIENISLFNSSESENLSTSTTNDLSNVQIKPTLSESSDSESTATAIEVTLSSSIDTESQQTSILNEVSLTDDKTINNLEMNNNNVNNNNVSNENVSVINEQSNNTQNGQPVNGNGYHTVSSGSGGQSKESVVLRLSNRIKSLEVNLSLTSQYLEELSIRYRKQMEEMQRAFTITINKLNDTTIRAIERDLKQHETIVSLEGKLSALNEQMQLLLIERENLNLHYIEVHICLMVVEVIIVVVILFIYGYRLSARIRVIDAQNKILAAKSQLKNMNNGQYLSPTKRVHPYSNHCHLPAKTKRIEGDAKLKTIDCNGSVNTTNASNKLPVRKKKKKSISQIGNNLITQSKAQYNNNDVILSAKSHSTPTLSIDYSKDTENSKALINEVSSLSSLVTNDAILTPSSSSSSINISYKNVNLPENNKPKDKSALTSSLKRLLKIDCK